MRYEASGSHTCHRYVLTSVVRLFNFLDNWRIRFFKIRIINKTLVSIFGEKSESDNLRFQLLQKLVFHERTDKEPAVIKGISKKKFKLFENHNYVTKPIF
jgi:hypothetical protein